MYRKILFSSVVFLFIFSVNAQENIPNMTLKTISGKSIESSEVLNSQGFSIISFWATWCIPCINELDAINELYDSWNENNSIKVLAISTDDARSKKRVRPMISGKNWAFDVYLDTNQNFKRSLNISGIPHTIIAYGSKIIHRRIGYSPGEEKDLLKIISNYKQK
jgi:peroxiredoxin|tara:strand:+ start:894 stop:1385 length:492 start_codon:yes stop_codon:yes gene_type:complete